MADKKPNRIIIKEMIEAGGCTKEILREKLGISAASLATNFSYLRLMGFYPISDKDGVLSFTDQETWDTMQTERSAKSATKGSTSTKTPQEKYIALVKRVAKCKTAEVNADKRASDNSDDELLDLRAQKAGIETKIAQYELDALLKEHSDDIDVSITEDASVDTSEPANTEGESTDADGVGEVEFDEEEDDLV